MSSSQAIPTRTGSQEEGLPLFQGQVQFSGQLPPQEQLSGWVGVWQVPSLAAEVAAAGSAPTQVKFKRILQSRVSPVHESPASPLRRSTLSQVFKTPSHLNPGAHKLKSSQPSPWALGRLHWPAVHILLLHSDSKLQRAPISPRGVQSMLR